MTMLFTTAEERNLVAEKYGAVEGLKHNMAKLGKYLAKIHFTTKGAKDAKIS